MEGEASVEREFGEAVGRLVGEVVEAPTERIESCRPLSVAPAEKPSRPGERLAVLAQYSVGTRERVTLRRAHDTAAGTNSSRTFAEHSTPGIPAPGCVPAPTR